MEEFTTTLQDGGRVVIPVTVRRALNIKPGASLVLRLDEGELRIFPASQRVERARQLLKPYIKEGVSLIDELIAERRHDAERDNNG